MSRFQDAFCAITLEDFKSASTLPMASRRINKQLLDEEATRRRLVKNARRKGRTLTEDELKKRVTKSHEARQRRQAAAVKFPARNAAYILLHVQNRNARIKRIAQHILGGGPDMRKFPANIFIEEETNAVKQANLHEAEYWFVRSEDVYWTDGSVIKNRDNDEISAAGVAWMAARGNTFERAEYPIGLNLGDSNHAELFAIAIALELAIQKVYNGSKAPIVIYSDSQAVLKALQNGNSTILGPMGTGRLALSLAYERAECLKEKKIPLTLRWVKGHNKSAGNVAADQAAGAASEKYKRFIDNARLPRGTVLFPIEMLGAGRDIRNEFLYRVEKGIQHPVRYVLALDHQREIPAGWIVDWRESGGFKDPSTVPLQPELYPKERELWQLFTSAAGTKYTHRSFPAKSIMDDYVKVDIPHTPQRRSGHPSCRSQWTYWTAGYFKYDARGNNTFMGAGVAWLAPDGKEVDVQGHHLGRNVGNMFDASLFAIASALKLAVTRVQEHSVAPVVIFADSEALLKSLQCGEPMALGPTISARLSLDDCYRNARALVNAGIEVTIRPLPSKHEPEGKLWANAAAVMDALWVEEPYNKMGRAQILPSALQGRLRTFGKCSSTE
ncbi:uncharacterized protein BDZ99DRAFT_471258 [Mytilinidion resinicola]|uniref:ribonuclease H n=1 Tax=Mytilinidion resinicola TaxID=574789 RepID=A0A6A6Z5E6_9PEZI|nr:uncharacterized protein BDZ99DRAFT_471258 [Mytilinidion resinicola]KAF2815959.1 hypothetical protein BDZ99DRAFT_471258 [Mytilinidion resinicola]